MTPYYLEKRAREAAEAATATPSPHAKLILELLAALLQHEADKEADKAASR